MSQGKGKVLKYCLPPDDRLGPDGRRSAVLEPVQRREPSSPCDRVHSRSPGVVIAAQGKHRGVVKVRVRLRSSFVSSEHTWKGTNAAARSCQPSQGQSHPSGRDRGSELRKTAAQLPKKKKI